MGTKQFAEFGHLFHDIKFISSYFSKINFCHVQRLGNNVAHNLTRRARSFDSTLVWMESIPPDIYDAYNNDLFLIE